MKHAFFDDVAFGPLNMGLEMEAVRHQVEKALETVGLKGFERRSAHHLCEGEKKRVALATVLSMNSKILVFDEPTDNLEPAGSRLPVERIRSVPRTNVIVTHHLMCGPGALREGHPALGREKGRRSPDGGVAEKSPPVGPIRI